MNPLFSLVRLTTVLLAFLFGGLSMGILLGDKPVRLAATLTQENWLSGVLLGWCAVALLLASLRWDCPSQGKGKG